MTLPALGNTTYLLDLAKTKTDDNSYSFEDYEGVYGSFTPGNEIDITRLVTQIFRSGKIYQLENNQLNVCSFDESNYINTTLYWRANYKDPNSNSDPIYIILPGEFLHFRCKNEGRIDYLFDVVIYVTETIITEGGQDKTISRIITNVMEDAPTTYLTDEIFQTCRDDLGNVYVIKSKENNENIEDKIIPFLNTNSTPLIPTNLSEYSNTIVDDNWQNININNYFNNNRLFYDSSYNNPSLNSKTLQLQRDSSVIVNDNITPPSPTSELCPFSCKMKGLLMFNRIGVNSDNANDKIMQNMKFDICAINDISIVSQYLDGTMKYLFNIGYSSQDLQNGWLQGTFYRSGHEYLSSDFQLIKQTDQFTNPFNMLDSFYSLNSGKTFISDLRIFSPINQIQSHGEDYIENISLDDLVKDSYTNNSIILNSIKEDKENGKQNNQKGCNIV